MTHPFYVGYTRWFSARVFANLALAVALTACGQGNKFGHPSQSAPQGVPAPSAILNNQNYPELRWDAVPGAMKYRVYYSVENGLPAGNTQHADINDTHFIVTDANANYAAVAALWGSNEGPRSSVLALPKSNGGPGGGNPGAARKVSFASATASINENETSVSLAVNLDDTATSDTTVSFKTRDSATPGLAFARAGADYVTANGSIVIPAGQSTGNISVLITNNTVYQGNRAFYVDLVRGTGTADADLGQIQTATVTILEDEARPMLSVNSPTVNEGASSVNARISLTVACAFDVSFDIATRNNTATSGADYTAIAAGQGTISAGTTSYTVPVTILNDTVPEPTENFFVDFSNFAGLTVTGNRLTSTVTIQDNDVLQAINDLTLKNGNTQVALSWTAVTGASSYNLYYANSPGIDPATCVTAASCTRLANITGSTQTISRGVTGLTNGLNYYFVATAVLGGVESLASNQTAARPRAPGPKRFPLNDTGLKHYGNATSNLLTAPPTGFPWQDAQVGRDASISLTKIGAGTAGFDFTKLDSSGQVTTSTNSWDCVRDNVTGLWWENKTLDAGLRDARWTYTWYSSNTLTSAGDTGTAGGGACFDNTGASCDTEKYVENVNKTGLCGFNDWRLPTLDELNSIVNFDACGVSSAASVDGAYFSNTMQGEYWSSSSDALYYNSAWAISFSTCSSTSRFKSTNPPQSASSPHTLFVRLLRGGP